MSTLLAEAFEKVRALPVDEQDRVASQILAELADDEAWDIRFAAKNDVVRRLADEALAEDANGGTLPFSEVF